MTNFVQKMTIFDKNYDKFDKKIESNFRSKKGLKIDPKIGLKFCHFRGQKWPQK